MSKTIEELQSYLEELEKRIKAMSKAHTTLELLIEITSYFDTVQHYLNDIEDSFDSHTINCNTFATQIASLQEQISTINLKLQNSSGNGNFDSTEINTKLQNLTTSLTTLETKLNSFMGENAISLDSLIEYISSLQTEVGSLQEQIDAITTEISSINESIGLMQTTITNLSTTQNSLSSAQNSMSANISTLETRVSTNETRLTTAETNIETNTTTVRGFNDRITNLELDYKFAYKLFDKCSLTLHMNSTENFVKSRKFQYYTKNFGDIEQNFTLNYISSGQGTITLRFYENNVLFRTYEINLSEHPNKFDFSEIYFTTSMFQDFHFEVSSTTSVIYTGLDCLFKGVNVYIFNHDKDLKIKIYDKKVYVTKYDNTKIYYGVFDVETFDYDTMTLDWFIDDVNDADKILYAIFLPVDYNSVTPYLVCEKSDGMFYYYTINPTTGELTLDSTIEYLASGEVINAMSSSGVFVIKDNKLHLHGKLGPVVNMVDNVENLPTTWLTANSNMHPSYTNSFGGVSFYALNENGKWYYFDSMYTKKPTLFGDYSSIHFGSNLNFMYIYGIKNNRIDKYKSSSKGISLVETIEDCDFVYETSLTKRIVHTRNGWESRVVES